MNFIKKWLCRDELARIERLKKVSHALNREIKRHVEKISVLDGELSKTVSERLDARLENQKLRGELEGARSELKKLQVAGGGKRKRLRAPAK